MKRKGILAVSVPTPSGKDYEVIATETDIAGEKHLVIDMFDAETWILRWAFTEKDYTRYLPEDEKWSRCSSYYLEVDGRSLTNFSTMHVTASPETEKLIRKRCRKHSDIVDCILELEEKINEEKSGEKRKQRKEQMESLFAEIPELPDDYEDYIGQLVDRENLIYYKRHGNNAEYRCAQCGYEFMRKKVYPYKGGSQTCPACKKTGTLRQMGRSRLEHVWQWHMLFQTTESGKLLIQGYETYEERSPWSRMKVETVPKYRGFFSVGEAYEYWDASWSDKEYWEMGGGHSTAIDCSKIYPGYMTAVQQSDIRYCPVQGLTSLMGNEHNLAGKMRLAIRAYSRCPHLEMLYKAGLKKVCREIIDADGCTSLINKRKKDMEGILRVEKQDVRWIREGRADELKRLEVCRYIKEKGMKNNEKNKMMLLILFYTKTRYASNPGKEEAENIMRYMSLEQAYNRVKEYAEKEFRGLMASAQTEYSDYLKMRAKLGYDMTNSVYTHPKNLRDTYALIRAEDEQKRDADYLGRMKQKFQKIAKQYERLCKKYSYEKDGLMVRPARDVCEIVMEGRILHHCVGSESQRYMRNHNDGKSFILMLRRTEVPEVPYATIEIRETYIQQWYQKNDRQPDRDIIDPWLREYVAHLEKDKKKVKIPVAMAG